MFHIGAKYTIGTSDEVRRDCKITGIRRRLIKFVCADGKEIIMNTVSPHFVYALKSKTE